MYIEQEIDCAAYTIQQTETYDASLAMVSCTALFPKTNELPLTLRTVTSTEKSMGKSQPQERKEVCVPLRSLTMIVRVEDLKAKKDAGYPEDPARKVCNSA